MPNYDYTCDHCKKTMEIFQKITEEPLKVCPECQKETLRREFSIGSVGLRFKGSGFYITDYCNKETSPSSGGSCGCKGSHSCD